MAKERLKAVGPYLAAAFFCEQVVEAKDGSLTAVRIIDQIQGDIPAGMPADFPSKENRLQIHMTGLLSFKTGSGPAGEHTIKITVESPQGQKTLMYEKTLGFTEPPHGGGNLILRGVLAIYSSGLFCFDVYLDGKFMTRMPISITYKKQEPAIDSQPSDSQPASASAKSTASAPSRSKPRRAPKKR
jgi:hypothetical protein